MELPRKLLRRPLGWFVLPGLLLWGVNLASAGLLDMTHVRAKADAPLQSDHPGFEVMLLDTHDKNALVAGNVRVPDNFGKVGGASLLIIDAEGKKLGDVALAPSSFPSKTPSFDFYLARSLLQNSTVSVLHDTADDFDVTVYHLGTFAVQDPKLPRPPLSAPKVRVVLAEQGVYDEDRNFTSTEQVPFVTGQTYGFRLYLQVGGGGSLPLRVEQTLPTAPKTWGDADTLKRLKISEDGRTASFTDLIVSEKLYENGGVVAEGDPTGDYVCKIFVRDELVKTFVFHVQPPPVTVPEPPEAKLPAASP